MATRYHHDDEDFQRKVLDPARIKVRVEEGQDVDAAVAAALREQLGVELKHDGDRNDR